jgi:SET domain-containing protein 6
LGILDDGYCIPRPSPQDLLEDILPEELLALVKILTLSPEQLLEYRAKNKPPKPTLSPREAQLLLAAVQARTGQYPSTIEQDEATLKQISNSAELFLSGSTRRKTMALQVRIGEKEILRQLSAMLSQFLASTQQNSDGSGAAKRTAQGDFEGQPGSAKAQKF